MHFKAKTILPAIILILLAGCVSTVVTYPPPGDTVFRLSSFNRRSVNLLVRPSETDQVIGHQYLLFLIPFGRIFHTGIGDTLAASAYRELSLAGVRPVVIAANTDPVPPNTLVLQAEDLQLTAYDLLFVRRNYTKMTLSGVYFGKDGTPKRTHRMTESSGEFRAYAFRKQLEPLFRENVDQTVKKLLSNIGITG